MINQIRKTVQTVSARIHWREVLAVLMLVLAIYFFRSERKELQAILPQLKQADPFWLMVALVFTVLTIVCHGGMYRQSFLALGLGLKWSYSIILFLKRNFISVFLPAGGVSSLAYSPSQIRKAGFNKIQVHQASGLFGFAGLLTVFIVGLPVIGFVIFSGGGFNNSWIGLLAVLAIIVLLFMAASSIRNKGMLHRFIDRKFPAFTSNLDEIFAANVNSRRFSEVVWYSMGVEICGILHVYFAMLALGIPANMTAAAAAYIISIVMMVISPFLRGLGAVEFSMVFVLEQFGYSTPQALSITILYRVFEFWLPLLAGLVAFTWHGRKIFFRLAPALLTFSLGIVNIISAVTPPAAERMRLLRGYVPLEAINASYFLILFVGITLLVTAAFMMRGLRNAWLIAIFLSVFSLIGNLTKALDYEAAIFAAITCVVLLATASQYRIMSSKKWMRTGIKTALLSFGAVLIFGFISFYYMGIKAFGIDFTWQQSLLHTAKIFLLVEDDSIQPVSRFGFEFVWFTRLLGFFTWAFLLFTLIKPGFKRQAVSESHKEKARFLLSQFGNAANDHFKVTGDKLFFFSEMHEGFVAYRVAGGFAIVLEEPVCAEENKIDLLLEFDRNCRRMGLRPAFYRVDENSIPWFNELRKRKLMIGQEAILEVESFTLEGKDKKSLRNGLNSLQKKGFATKLHQAPQSPEFLATLKRISDEWLNTYERNELVFSQGMFDAVELKSQNIITLEDAEGNVKAFLNIVPDYSGDECTYDLIRKTDDAPGAAMDALIIKLIEYARNKQQQFINLGLVPMTGITQPENAAEQIIKLASQKIKRFQHYKGLREFKEKYATYWENKYLVYDNDVDLIELPRALNIVMKP